ncbi:MAG: NADH-quinone oxidoreductase subunit M, partial [Nitrosospira sp.]
MLFGLPLLSLVIWLPILAGVGVLATGGDRNAQLARWIALIGSVAGLLVAIPLYTQFDSLSNGMQFVEYSLWIESFNIHYHLGVDGIAMPLILLNCFTTPLVVMAGWQVISKRVSQYMAAFLIMSGIVNGVFSSLDAILFYVFWEASLIPMFLIIGVWGGPNRVYASIKFFLYTLLGSLLMLVAFIYLYQISGGSFSILDYHKLPLPLMPQILIFIAFTLAFAVKVPMWPVHTWLPDAHVEAPTGGSVVLAAILLKMGGYGFLRFSLPIVPDASQYLAGMMIALSLIAIVYIGLVALIQADMKKLIAYSSVAHMGFVTLGFFLFNAYGLEGAMVQMISHGFISAAMFLCIGVMYDRLHSRQIADYGGLASRMPVFAAFFMLFAMANTGLPGTSGFVGEFIVIMAAMKVNFLYAFFAATTLITGAAYTLWMYKRVIFGAVVHPAVEEMKDIGGR